jgi:3-isopropylmalate/(R)-2-methylmalate dehydratase small subunit
VPMLTPNVDTDQIIPALFVGSRTEEKFVHALFRNERDKTISFILNDPKMKDRQIIFAGPDFGCGSSREAAVWALMAGGFQTVISTAFSDIFRQNSLKYGLLPVLLTDDQYVELTELVHRNPDILIDIDLQSRKVTSNEGSYACPLRMDEFDLHLLVEGMGSWTTS